MKKERSPSEQTGRPAGPGKAGRASALLPGGPGEAKPIVSREPDGKQRLLALESGARAAAAKLGPAGVELFYCILVLALWILIHKVEARRGRAKTLQEELAQVPGVAGRREQDLQCRLLLLALEEEGYLASADRKQYRRDSAPLYAITHQQLKAIARKYRSLRELQRRFGGRKSRTPEDKILEELARLKRLLEDHPDAELPETAHAQWLELHNLMLSLRQQHGLAGHRNGRRAGGPLQPLGRRKAAGRNNRATRNNPAPAFPNKQPRKTNTHS